MSNEIPSWFEEWWKTLEATRAKRVVRIPHRYSGASLWPMIGATFVEPCPTPRFRLERVHHGD